jgi:hypothetical protein
MILNTVGWRIRGSLSGGVPQPCKLWKSEIGKMLNRFRPGLEAAPS